MIPYQKVIKTVTWVQSRKKVDLGKGAKERYDVKEITCTES